MTSASSESIPVNYTRLIKPLILLFCTATLLMTCLKIIGYGYFPYDDALRHVAKVVSGKDWNDIMVLRQRMVIDSHPGWHALLGLVYRMTGVGKIGLLNFSVISLFLIFVILPAFAFNRPEAWIASLTLMVLFSFGPMIRTLFGRPFAFTMFVSVMFCFLWKMVRDQRRPYMELTVYGLLVALSTWIHGTWYFLSLPLFALFLSRQWRVFLLMGIATVAGVALGAVFTGHPVLFIHQMILQAFFAVGSHAFARQLVTELQPFSGEAFVVILVFLFLLWRRVRDDWKTECVDNPVFFLFLLGWVLGFWAVRMWSDWGWPALACWIALEIQSVLNKYVSGYTFKGLFGAIFICLLLFLSMTADVGSRWSNSTMAADWPSMENSDQRSWLPDSGGILYSDNMSVFYRLFFQNPEGPWKYILGFEPTWMPEEDLAIFRNIQLTRGKDDSYAPWVDKMTDKDRMVLVRGEQPKIKGLEWHEVTPSIWSGKLIAPSQKNNGVLPTK